MEILKKIEARQKFIQSYMPNNVQTNVERKIQWEPQFGPQFNAYHSRADVIGYGGAAGGGKTDLAIGLSLKHKRSIIFRRVFPNAYGIIDRTRELFGGITGNKYNDTIHLWKLMTGSTIQISHMRLEKDKENHRGQARDFMVFDEATEFSESQFRFVSGWNRSTNPYQHCQTLLTFNPPMDEGANWIIDYFMAWFAYLFPEKYQHPNPAQPGELRWYIRRPDHNGVDRDEEVPEENLQNYIEVLGKMHVVESDKICLVKVNRNGIIRDLVVRPQKGIEINGQVFRAKSRTFFLAKLSDNPLLEATGYGSTIDAMPEPLRSLLKGNFNVSVSEDPFQVIPTSWVRLAQKRWEERKRPATLSQMGVDAARGGGDEVVLADRYENFFDSPFAVPGVTIKNGQQLAQLVVSRIGKHNPLVNIDAIGIGSSPFDFLSESGVNVKPIIASHKTDETDRRGVLKFRNVRALMWWRFREMLDPETGDDIALPPDRKLFEELIAPKWKISTSGVQIEEKQDIIDRIGRSTNRADAVIQAAFVPKDQQLVMALTDEQREEEPVQRLLKILNGVF